MPPGPGPGMECYAGDSMSPLGAVTVEAAPARLHDAADRSAARGAGLPFPAVDPEGDLEVAAVALAVREVVERRPALLDGLPEHRHGRLRHPRPARRRDPPHRPV